MAEAAECQTCGHSDRGCCVVTRPVGGLSLSRWVCAVDPRPNDAPMASPTMLPAAVEMLQELRRELATTLAGVAGIPTVRPLRTYRREQDDYETRIWHDGEVLCVLTCHGSSMGPTLHIAAQAGRNGWPHLHTMPDWTCLGADEAFEIAGALLGAALAVTA